MKAKYFFLFSCFLCGFLSFSKAQTKVHQLQLNLPDTICADINPLVRLSTTLGFGGPSGPVNVFTFWDYGDGTSQVRGLIPSHHYHYFAKAGTYKVKVSLQASLSGDWETASDSQLIVVQRNCQTGQAADLNMKQDTACAGWPAQFGDSLAGDFSHLSFRWDFGDGTFSPKGWGVKHVYSQPGLYAASLCIVDHNLQDTLCIQQLIPVKSCQLFQSLAIDGPDTVCLGTEKYLFSPRITGGSGHFHYGWSALGSGVLFSNPDTTKRVFGVAFTQAGNVSISLKVTDLVTGIVLAIRDTLVTQTGASCPLSVNIGGPGTTFCLSSGYNPYFIANVRGGSGQYTYDWQSSPGNFNGSGSTFLPAFQQTGLVAVDITITDQLTLQQVHDTVQLTLTKGDCEPYVSTQNLVINPERLCQGTSFNYYNFSPSSSYTGFSIDFGDGTVKNSASGVHTYAAAGLYTVAYCLYNPTLGDTFCLSRQLYVAPVCELKIAVLTTDDFGNDDGTAHAYILQGNGQIELEWDSTGTFSNTFEISGLAAGTYHLYARDGQGRSDTIAYRINPYATAVFPGDCNHDQVADMKDLLPIGLKYNMTGFTRPNASLNWTPQPALPWGDSLANGRDIRHVDTDGNGIINDADTLAIQLNYSFTHNNLRTGNTGPKLFYQMPMGPHTPGDTLRIPIHLATMDTPVVSLYGLTFGISYDTALIQGGSIRLDFGNSWLGTKGSNLLTMYREDSTRGQVAVGFVRKDQMNVSGFGRICDIIVVVDDHIGKRNIPLRMGFLSPYGIDKAEEEVNIGWINGETDIATDISEEMMAQMGLAVGQSDRNILLYHPTEKTGVMQLIDIRGNQLIQQKLKETGQTAISTKHLSPGIYILEVRIGNTLWRKKVALL